MKEMHTYMSVLKCFLDIHSEMKILISELTVNFVFLEDQQHEWLQENSCAG